jgi:hypothetical protein
VGEEVRELARFGVEDLGIARKERSDKGSIKITGRDLEALRFIGEQYAVRFDQLARLLKRPEDGRLSESATRAVVARWEKAGLSASKKLIAGDPRFVWLTRKGLEEVGLAFKPWSPTVVSLAHIFWTNQVRMHTEDRHPESAWRSERELRNGRSMQTISTDASHDVDAEIHLPQGVVAVEVELTSKSVERRRSIMAQVAQRYATVWYFAPANVHALLEQTAASVPLNERIRIYPLERVA